MHGAGNDADLSAGAGGYPAVAGAVSVAGAAGTSRAMPQGGSAGAAGGAAGEGGAGDADTPPIDQACEGDRAFAVVSSAFVEPTREDLALALNAATYGKSPLAIVLRASEKDPTIAASYTKAIGSLREFPGSLIPEFVPAWVAEGGFGSGSAQREGWLLVTLDSGPLEVPLKNINLFVTTRDRCTKAFASLSAVIPGDDADLVDRIVGAPVDPDDEDEPDEPGLVDTKEVPVQALLVLELADFNFDKLP